jgi:hypothetical protein
VNNEWANDAHDQWNPALDPDSNGNYLVTWYDRRDDSANNTYRVYATKIHADGTPVDTTDTLVYNSAVGADPTVLPVIGGVRSIGEYQDVFEWFGTWYGSTTYIEYKSQLGATTQDIYLPRITP